MPVLRSRQKHPPYGFQFLQPETGQGKPFAGSFDNVVNQVMALRRGNKALAEKHGWATDREGVERDVDQQNCDRCIKAGWLDFVQMDAPEPPPAPRLLPGEEGVKKKAGVVDGVKRIGAGIGVLVEWLGAGGKPVDGALSEKRAAICATCPKNGGGDWKAYFTAPIANKIRLQREMKTQLKLRTSQDEKLQVCTGCDCPLSLKVHTPIEHILNHTTPEVKAALDPRCWVLSEA